MREAHSPQSQKNSTVDSVEECAWRRTVINCPSPKYRKFAPQAGLAHCETMSNSLTTLRTLYCIAKSVHGSVTHITPLIAHLHYSQFRAGFNRGQIAGKIERQEVFPND